MNKKILLVAMGLLAIFTAFAKDCPKEMPSLDNKGAEFARENRLTCLHKEYYGNGNLKEIVNFKNGQREGERKRENGNIILKKETSKRLEISKMEIQRENINGIIKMENCT